MEHYRADKRWISLARRHLAEIARYRTEEKRQVARLQRAYPWPQPSGTPPEDQLRRAVEWAQAQDALLRCYTQLAEAMLLRHQREEQDLIRWLEQEHVRQN